ncbi:TolC family outer membrane protein [Sneathiella sp. P13V-1]|uniref:TolC family outer membrane protein n=1 Tax=Sneathiella sp. P13V-1 TaxID=2697366 RepID=UPI00187B9EBD|nr:TolC family outer membrane protein [Sneathiella sp. P13V-1]MBE7638117.1 TolC family outer membrane protein [Sneathiella sp. P13V-1]
MKSKISSISARNVISAGVVAAVFGGALMAAPVQAASLKDAVQATVTNYPEIAEAAANRRAIGQELEQAEGLYYPSVDLAIGAGKEWTDTNTIDDEWLTRTEGSITLTQTLIDGGFRAAEVDRQESRIDGAAYRVRERSEAIGLDTVQAYLDVLRNLEVVNLATENLEIHKRTLKEIRDRADAGQSGVGDVQQTESRVAAAEAALTETLRQLDESEIAYRRLVGEAPVNLELPSFKDDIIPDTLEDVVSIGLESNPDIRFANADVVTSEAEIRAAEANFYPTVNLELGASANNDLDGVEGHSDDFTAMVRMRYNLYRGGIDVGRQQEAMERSSESKQRKMRFERLVEEEIRQSWSILMRSQARSVSLGDQVVANGQVAATYRQEFQIGQRDLLDMLDADNELFNSRTALTTVEYAVLFAKYRLLATMGRLNSTLGVTLPEEALPNDNS